MPPWGFRQEDFPPVDVGCWLELARSWDFAFVARSLGRYRLHERSFTAAHLQGLDNVREMRRVKLAFLDRSYPPGRERRRLERLAHRSLRHELLVRVRLATLPERRIGPTARGLPWFARTEPGLLREPAAWALLAGSLVGQRGVTALRRFLPERRP